MCSNTLHDQPWTTHKQQCFERHGQADWQDTGSAVEYVRGEGRGGMECRLLRDSCEGDKAERMIQQKIQMHTFLFSRVFIKSNKN